MTGFKRRECEGELSLISILAPHFKTRKSIAALLIKFRGKSERGRATG